MSSKIEKSSMIIKLLYEINAQKKIKIFHPYFVLYNKNNCKMVINNKMYSLTDEFEIENEKIKFLKIKLLILKQKKINLSFMLCKCESLKKFNLISLERLLSEKEEFIDKNKINKTGIIDTDLFENLSNQSNVKLKNIYNNTNSTNILNQSIKIFYINNESNENNENEKMNYIINLSHDFLTSSYTLNDLKNNNYFEYSSFNEYSFSLTFFKLKNGDKNVFIEFKNYKKGNILATDLKYMFFGCSSLLSITSLSKINTNNIFDMSHMFENCSLLKVISGIYHWNMNKVININNMFSIC